MCALCVCAHDERGWFKIGRFLPCDFLVFFDSLGWMANIFVNENIKVVNNEPKTLWLKSCDECTLYGSAYFTYHCDDGRGQFSFTKYSFFSFRSLYAYARACSFWRSELQFQTHREYMHVLSGFRDCVVSEIFLRVRKNATQIKQAHNVQFFTFAVRTLVRVCVCYLYLGRSLIFGRLANKVVKKYVEYVGIDILIYTIHIRYSNHRQTCKLFFNLFGFYTEELHFNHVILLIVWTNKVHTHMLHIKLFFYYF